MKNLLPPFLLFLSLFPLLPSLLFLSLLVLFFSFMSMVICFCAVFMRDMNSA